MASQPPVRLRRLTQDDLPQLHAWYQTPGLWEHLVGDFHQRSEAEALAYMAGWLAPSEAEVRLAIEAEDGVLLGLASLAPVDRAARKAELHLFLGEPENRRRGFGRAVVDLLLDHGFGALDLQTIKLKVLATNTGARRLYERAGFRRIGVRPEPAIKGGWPVEVIEMAIGRGAWVGAQADSATT